MLRAAVWPCRSRDDPVLDANTFTRCGSGQRAISPAAKMPGALVSRYSSTTTPRSIASPASSLATPRAARRCRATTMSAGSALAVFERHATALRSTSGASPRWKCTPCSSCSLRMKSPSSGPRTRSSGSASGRHHVHLEIARAQRCGDLEPDEARAEHDGAAWPLRAVR